MTDPLKTVRQAYDKNVLERLWLKEKATHEDGKVPLSMHAYSQSLVLNESICTEDTTLSAGELSVLFYSLCMPQKRRNES